MTESAVIAHDLPCIGCGYNLRTLPAGARCPECGRAVGESIRSDGLRLADLNWLRRVRGGVTLTIIGLLTFFMLQVADFCMVVFGRRDWSRVPRFYEVVSYIAVAAIASILLGVLIAMTREPGRARPSKVSRLLIIAWASVEAMQLLLPAWPVYLQLSYFQMQLADGLHTGLRVTAVVVVLLSLRGLARRDGRRRLARATSLLALLVVLSGLLSLTAWFQITFHLPAATLVFDSRYTVINSAGAMCGLLSVLGGGVLLLFYRRMLSSIIRYGKPEGTTESHGSHRA